MTKKSVAIKRKENGKIVLNINPQHDALRNMSIDEYFENVVDHYKEIESNYQSLNEYYNNDIPENVLNEFKVYPYVDYVLENLNTHDSDLMINRLKKDFPIFDIKDLSETDDKIRYINIWFSNERVSNDDILTFLRQERFKNIIDFYGYSLSDAVKKSSGVNVKLEPVYSENANDYVYDTCKGKLYHITSKKFGERILKSGLRIKDPSVREKRYREFPKRIYFLGIPDTKYPLRSDEMRTAITTYLDNSDADIMIFEVDVKGLGINFYKDTVSDIDDIHNAVYCYSNIPENRVRLIFDGRQDQII